MLKYIDRRTALFFVLRIGIATIYTILNTFVILLINEIFNQPDRPHLVGILVAIFGIQIILGSLQRWIATVMKTYQFTMMSNKFTDKLLSVDHGLFLEHSVADIVGANAFNLNVGRMIDHFMTIILYTVSILSTLWGMWMIAPMVIVPVIIAYGILSFWIVKLNRKLNELADQSDQLKRNRDQTLENCVMAFSDIRAFRLQRPMHKKIIGMNKQIRGIIDLRAKWLTVLIAIMELFDGIGMLVTILYSIWAVSQGIMTPTSAISLVMLVVRIVDPIAGIIDGLDQLTDLGGPRKFYDKIMGYENRVVEGSKPKKDFQHSITVSDVSFCYPEHETTIIDGISMEIPKGSRIGICGESGGGKTTLLRLLHHFYDVNSGSIQIDGMDLRDINPEDLMRLIGSVEQDVTIVPGTILENILMAKPDATDEAIIDAIEKSACDFIQALPNGLNTIVGPRGLKLSGGQRQRISLARLFLRNPEIIILDEATSALDNETENLIQDAISHLEGKTIITVAHRLSTIRDSDCIYVMDHGKVIEHGTHDDLMQNPNSIYQTLQK